MKNEELLTKMSDILTEYISNDNGLDLIQKTAVILKTLEKLHTITIKGLEAAIGEKQAKQFEQFYKDYNDKTIQDQARKN